MLSLTTCAVRDNLSNAAMWKNPELAVRLAGGNGDALNRVVAVRFAQAQQDATVPSQGSRNTRDRVPVISVDTALASQAMAALDREPFALASLALLSQIVRQNGRLTLADRLLDHAAALSRREWTTQLLLIQRAVKRGDIADSIAQIDIAMRSQKGGYDVMFPALTRQLRNPRVIPPLMKVARDDPDWFHLFLGHAVTDPSALPGVEKLMRANPASRFARDRQLRVNLLTQLVASRQYALADSYFRSLHGDSGQRLNDPEFRNPDLEEPFGWTVRQEAGLRAEFTRDQGLALFAGQEREGTVASQLLALSAGSYFVSLEGEQKGLTAVRLQLSCHNSARQLEMVRQDRPGIYRVVVPESCPRQIIEVGLGNSGNIATIQAAIRRIDITPA